MDQIIFNIIITLCMYIAVPILYFSLRNETKPKKNLILGTTLPSAVWEAKEVRAVCRRFLGGMNLYFLLITLSLPLGLLFGYSSVILTYDLVWLLLALLFPFMIYGHACRTLRQIKREKGWYLSGGTDNLAELKVASMPQKPLNAMWFLPPVLLSLIPLMKTMIFTSDAMDRMISLWIFGGNAVMVILFYVMFRFCYRNKSEAIDSNTMLTEALTRVRRYNWSKCWVAMTWMTAVYTVALSFCSKNLIAVLILTVLYIGGVVVFSCQTEFAARGAQQRLTAKAMPQGSVLDDDDQWLLGIFYMNPQDSHLVRNARIGMNSTVNLAHPAGKILTLIGAVLIVTLPLWGVVLMAEEFTPISISIRDGELVSYHLKEEYTIPVDQITGVELLEELPDTSKQIGTNLPGLWKGSFAVSGISNSCTLLLNPEKDCFIMVKTEKKTYLFSTESDTQTQKIYQQIQEEIGA